MELQEVIAKMIASRKLLETKLQGNRSGKIRIEDIEVVYKRYAELRGVLQSDYPSLFNDLPRHTVPPEDGTNSGIPLTNTYYVWKLIEDMNYCLDVLSSVGTASSPSATVTSQGVFFSGQFFDALLKISDLISQAQKTIIIVDGYIDGDVLNLLSAKSSGITADILTKTVPAAVSTLANAFNKQHGGLSIRTSQAFHDRFLFIDDHDFYHFGASIKNLGGRGFMFSRIEETLVINALRTEFASEWAKSTVVI